MAFDWNQYQPETGGITGNSSVDPSQLQVQPPMYGGGYTGMGGSAPPNNPGAAPQPDHIDWGSAGFDDPGTARGNANANYYNLFTNYWAPDRDQVLSDARNSATAGTKFGGISLQNPAPTSPMNGGGGIYGGGNAGGGVGGSWGGGQGYTTAPGVNINPQTGQAQVSGDPQQFFNNLFPGDTLTPDMLTQNEAALKAQGITLVRNAAGVPGKIKLPNGQVVDVIQGAGSGLNKKQWLVGDSGGGAGGGTLGSLGFGSGAFVSPIGQFTPPSAADAMNSPGTQYSIDEAMRTLQNSAAAKGTLLNGRTLQGELGAIQNLAAGQYGDVYQRALNTFGTNYGVQTRNQDAPFDKYLSLAKLGQGAAAAS